ncbi:MAG: hypothetical protein ABSE98_15440, partial [Acidimicrobiales bacterium]
AARRAFDEGPWPRMTHAERAEFLTGFATGLRGRADDIGQIVLDSDIGAALFVRDPDGQLIELLPVSYRDSLPPKP